MAMAKTPSARVSIRATLMVAWVWRSSGSMDPRSGPERLEGIGVVVEESDVDDSPVLDPHQQKITAVVRLSGALPRRCGNRDRLGVTREGVDELGMERPSAQFAHPAEVLEDRGPSAMLARDQGRTGNTPDRVFGNQLRQCLHVPRMECLVELAHQNRIWMRDHISPLLSTLLAAAPRAAEGLVDQARPCILEDPEGIATRVLEDVTGSRGNLDGSTLRLPTAGPQVLRRRFQILHFEQGQARGSG